MRVNFLKLTKNISYKKINEQKVKKVREDISWLYVHVLFLDTFL